MAEDTFNPNLPELINDEFYIPPDTDIYILSGVPLDNTYEHTIEWGDMTYDRKKQRDYFLSKAKAGVKKQSYQRVDREWFKVYINADYLYDCNYIMFKNNAYNPNKWWYGFILDVEYINNNTSKIRYELDVMQTWLPGQYMDYIPLPCFVERCHSMSDFMYENLIPENVVNNDEYMVDTVVEFDMSSLSVVVLATEVYSGESVLGIPTFSPATGNIKYGTFGAVAVTTWKIFNENGVFNQAKFTELNKYLNMYIRGGKENSIVSVFMYPSRLIIDGYIIPNTPELNDPLPEVAAVNISITPPKQGDKLGGNGSTFKPKNNKLYSYPFNLLKVNNECGTTKVYKWELFDQSTAGKFQLKGADVWMPCVAIYPLKYRKISMNMEDCITFENFPICPWSSDAFMAWWAQNAAHVTTDALGGAASLVAAIVGAGVGGATANPMLVATGVGGAISAATKIGTSLYEAHHTPAAEHGNVNTSLILPALKNLKFVITKESMRPEILQIYDDYFTRFGYAQKKIMYPPRANREKWTYVQTVGFEFNGEINDRDTKKIKSIYDTGITFWVNPEEVGHYEFSNAPLV